MWVENAPMDAVFRLKVVSHSATADAERVFRSDDDAIGQVQTADSLSTPMNGRFRYLPMKSRP
jgi:hypothetical protein